MAAELRNPPGRAGRWLGAALSVRLRPKQVAWPAGTALGHTLTSFSPLAPWLPLELAPAAAAGRATSVAKSNAPTSTPTIARRYVRMDAPSTSAATPVASRVYQIGRAARRGREST